MRIRFTIQNAIDTLIELVGVKSGLSLPEWKLIEFLDKSKLSVQENVFMFWSAGEWWTQPRDDVFVIRAEEFEAIFLAALKLVGSIHDTKGPTELVFDYVRKHHHLFGLSPVPTLNMNGYMKAISELNLLLCGINTDISKNLFSAIPDWISFKNEWDKRYLLSNSYPSIRSWDGIIPLATLFDSEEAPATKEPDAYIDQRYIDYLYHQSGDLIAINWRQFEYLTAEYFRRIGYSITLLSGRKDGGKDVLARRETDVGPELILIQCKRYSLDRPVGIETVKAFWSTVQDEGATKGLVATTSNLTSGAKDYCTARLYRLAHEENNQVHNWLQAMASQPSTAFG